MYAIISLGGHQRLVHEKQEIIVDRLEAKEGSAVDITEVLATFDDKDDSVVVGTPFVKGATVKAKVLTHDQGEKLHVIKFQNKKRYRRKIGFRPQQTVLLIEKITA